MLGPVCWISNVAEGLSLVMAGWAQGIKANMAPGGGALAHGKVALQMFYFRVIRF
jgi:hypothetical protein